jgi:ASPIC and UnbV
MIFANDGDGTFQILGLGNATQADEISVQWPDGRETTSSAVAANQTLRLSHPDL